MRLSLFQMHLALLNITSLYFVTLALVPSPDSKPHPPVLAPKLYWPTLTPSLFLLALTLNFCLPTLTRNLHLLVLVPVFIFAKYLIFKAKNNFNKYWIFHFIPSESTVFFYPYFHLKKALEIKAVCSTWTLIFCYFFLVAKAVKKIVGVTKFFVLILNPILDGRVKKYPLSVFPL